MMLSVTPMRERGKARPKRDIESAVPVSGDLTIVQAKSDQYGRMTKIASFHTTGVADKQPLPPLHDVEISWMGPLGFVLTGIEFVGEVAYGQSWFCRLAS
jgi:hypothetical protein